MNKILNFVCIAAALLLLAACGPEIATPPSHDAAPKSHTTLTESYDENGNKVLIVNSRRDEGYTVHPSTQTTNVTETFICEAFTAETLISTYKDNADVTMIGLGITINGEKMDLQSIIGAKADLRGNANINTHFVCVDHILRIIISGQPILTDNSLASEVFLIDLLIDRDNGEAKLNPKTFR